MTIFRAPTYAGKPGLRGRTAKATLLAAILHGVGALGMAFLRRDWFLVMTPWNILLMFVLLAWTLPEKNLRVYVFFTLCFLTGMGAEIAGVKTGLLFGTYGYGDVMGYKVGGVPLLIGINWFIVVYASGMIATQVRKFISQQFYFSGKPVFSSWLGFSLVIDGALVATLFDWIMEPAAVKLGFWSWSNGSVPLLNYLSWFAISLVLLFFFRHSRLKMHPFAINLLLIQALFFFVLR